MKLFRKIFAILALGLFLFLAVSLLFNRFFNPITTIYNVTVETEQVATTTLDNNNSRWALYGAEIHDYDSIRFESFNGELKLEKNVQVTLQRVANGPIIITATSTSDEPLGTFFSEEGSRVYRPVSFVEIIIRDMQSKAMDGLSFLFSIDGAIELGRKVDQETYGDPTAILRGGEIKLIGKSGWGNAFFEAGTENLYLGDKLVIKNQIGKAYGFAVVNEKPGMEVAYRAMAKEAKVLKPGPEDDDAGYSISASLLDKISNDQFFIGISVLVGMLLVFITISTFIMDIYSFNQERNNNG